MPLSLIFEYNQDDCIKYYCQHQPLFHLSHFVLYFQAVILQFILFFIIKVQVQVVSLVMVQELALVLISSKYYILGYSWRLWLRFWRFWFWFWLLYYRLGLLDWFLRIKENSTLGVGYGLGAGGCCYPLGLRGGGLVSPNNRLSTSCSKLVLPRSAPNPMK